MGALRFEPATLDSESVQVHGTPSHSLREADMAEAIHTYTYTWKAEHAGLRVLRGFNLQRVDHVAVILFLAQDIRHDSQELQTDQRRVSL